jgi:hypothetical protein
LVIAEALLCSCHPFETDPIFIITKSAAPKDGGVVDVSIFPLLFVSSGHPSVSGRRTAATFALLLEMAGSGLV